jgi:transcriptional repressor of cell division inhibition gene dicB
MKKQQAIQVLGGSISAAAHAIGITYQAVNQWPDELSPRIADRVDAAIARRKRAAAAKKAKRTDRAGA